MRTTLSILLASVVTGVALGDQVYLRNSIGPTNATTDGNGWYNSTYDIENNSGFLSPVRLTETAGHDVRLTSIRVILGQFAILGIGQFEYSVRAWDSWNALIAYPRNGTITNIAFPIPTSLHTYGIDAYGWESFEGVFDLHLYDVVLPANGTLWVAVEITSPDTDTFGDGGIMESFEPQPPPPNDEPDRQLCHYCPNGWHFTTDADCYWRLHDGRLAYEVIGETLGASCPGDRGDANCDGTLDFFDIDPFLTALFDPATYAAGFCGGSVCAADADCSDVVDFFDIDPFLNCLFSGCAPCP